MDNVSASGRRIRPRALVLGALLGALICALTPYNNSYLNGAPLGGGTFPLAAFCVALPLTLLVAVVRRLTGWRLLHGTEVVTVWALMAMASGVAYTGLARTFFINLTAPSFFASEANRWSEVLGPVLPAGLYPTDRAAIDALYSGIEGGRRLGWLEFLSVIPWSAWVGPLTQWAVFLGLAYLTIVSLVGLFSRQWIVNERMNAPLLAAPMEAAEALDRPGGLWAFLADRRLLAGLAIPVCLHLVNGLSFYEPSLPQIPTLLLAGKYFSKTGLFSGFYKLKLLIVPAFAGFAFLSARQMSFSFWFFYLFAGLLTGVLSVSGLQIPSAALGVTFGPTLSRPEEMQTLGGWMAMFVFFVWLSRRHLLQAARAALGLEKEARVRTEDAGWSSPANAMRGFAVGVFGLLAWAVWKGMSPWAAAVALFVFLAVGLTAARIVCQGGLAWFTLNAAPLDGPLAVFGSGMFGSSGLILAAAMQKMLFVDLREAIMPALLHTAKVSERVGNRRALAWGLTVTLALAVVVSLAATLALFYRYGGRELQIEWALTSTQSVYDAAARLLQTPGETRGWSVGFATAGAVVTGLLILGYQRFPWWPLHPAGYLAAYGSAMNSLWFSCFVGWAVSHLAVRYGGASAMRALRPFFIGLIIGDFLMAGVFAVVGFWAGSSYQAFPN